VSSENTILINSSYPLMFFLYQEVREKELHEEERSESWRTIQDTLTGLPPFLSRPKCL
jgi:hypothetical protein